jgi:hypothetical protein
MKTATAARPHPVYDPVHLLGRVSGREQDGRYRVECDGRAWRARRAASCLLVPEQGDEVLISGPDPSRIYLIAVTEQADPRHTRLEMAGDVVMASADGDVALESPRAVSLRGQDAVRVETGAFSLQAQDARCVTDRMRYVATEVQATVGMTRLIGKAYEAVLDRLSTISRLSFRTTQDVEQVRAGTLDYEAEQAVRLHGEYTLVTGQELVKVDAKQIHMG